MALEILNAKKVAENGLLSKIQIGGKVYEIKDLIARENLEALALLIDALDLNKADKEQVAKDIAAAIAGKADKDQVALDIAAAVANLANKDQVAQDIASAVAAEAEIARAAEKVNADEIARVDAALKLAIDDEDGKGLNSIKDLATWIEEHGEDAAEMSAAITKNAGDIANEAKAREDADAALSGRLDAVEEMLDGDGSVAEQIEAAKEAAIEAANDYTDGEIDKLGDLAHKNEADLNLKALAHADSASGVVAGQTISGVKATGTTTGSINVELEQSEHAMNSTGKYTPAGGVSGSVTVASHQVPVAVSHTSESATLTKGDYTPAGDVSVSLSGASFNKITGVGTQASFQEGAFTPAELKTKDITIAAHNHLEAAIDENDADAAWQCSSREGQTMSRSLRIDILLSCFPFSNENL